MNDTDDCDAGCMEFQSELEKYAEDREIEHMLQIVKSKFIPLQA
jgi:hypothetical protein